MYPHDVYYQKTQLVRKEVQKDLTKALHDRFAGKPVSGAAVPEFKETVEKTTHETLRRLWVQFTNDGDRIGLYVLSDLIDYHFERADQPIH